MAERTVVVASKVGPHARPAMMFTQAAARTGAAVTIARAGEALSMPRASSFVMGTGVKIVLASDDSVLDPLVALLATDLDAQ